MSKLKTYRVIYRITAGYHVEVEASSSRHAEEWAQTLLDRNGIALPGSENFHSDVSITGAIEMVGPP